jgi:hypothetical protein
VAYARIVKIWRLKTKKVEVNMAKRHFDFIVPVVERVVDGTDRDILEVPYIRIVISNTNEVHLTEKKARVLVDDINKALRVKGQILVYKL